MEFEGVLYTYNQETRLTAFESKPLSSRVLVFIGGLGDGYNAVPFLRPLQKELANIGWSLVQVQLSSSNNGYGTSSLAQDVEELDELVKYLKTREKSEIVFMGHSTGSQDCLLHSRRGEMRDSVSGYLLQAPVSDREGMQGEMPKLEEYIELATKLCAERKGEAWMPHEIGVPMTASRFFSLFAVGGDDDMFSSDLSDEFLSNLYKDVDRPMLLLGSECDEFYKPTRISQRDLLKRFASFSPLVSSDIVSGADHSVTQLDSQPYLCQTVLSFIKERI
ncbi:hypothetical protein J3Q64DRAFT_1770094 [Phycomyces blakesleeanus]|uniref:Uncharacterized protein n=1 Tax=Phycomyces blakesleeanus TaxID=4837 RepID=A0ABR3AMH7_PHYBL